MREVAADIDRWLAERRINRPGDGRTDVGIVAASGGREDGVDG